MRVVKIDVSAALNRGPNPSERTLDKMSALKKEAKEKSSNIQCRLISSEEVKNNPSPQIKISQAAAITHKIRKLRAIIDLSLKQLLNVF